MIYIAQMSPLHNDDEWQDFYKSSNREAVSKQAKYLTDNKIRSRVVERSDEVLEYFDIEEV